MRTLASALNEGLISPKLADLWCKQNNLPSPYVAALHKQVALILLVVGIFCLNNGLWLGHTESYDDALAGIVLLLGTVILFVSCLVWCTWIKENKKADVVFLRDCAQLNHFLSGSGYYGKEELFEKARRNIVSFISELLRNEKQEGKGSSEAEKSRERFKNAHAAMLRFGLVNEKWDEYFAEITGA